MYHIRKDMGEDEETKSSSILLPLGCYKFKRHLK